jgi:F-type H+-transporting ATPase subunit b
MLINWFTVIAQIFNFLVLIWLLKRFLYKPILNAIDAREKYVADKLALAENDMQAAQKEREEFNEKNKAFERQRAELLHQTEEEVRQQRLQLLESVRREYEDLQAKANRALLRNDKIFNQALGLRTSAEIFAIVRKTLADLSGVKLEERIVEVFSSKLQELSQGEKARLLSASESTPGDVVVRTMFELSSGQRALLEKTITESLALAQPVRFETASGLVSGIELEVNNQKIAWNISDYLDKLEMSIKEYLDKQLGKQHEARVQQGEVMPENQEKKAEKGDQNNGGS